MNLLPRWLFLPSQTGSGSWNSALATRVTARASGVTLAGLPGEGWPDSMTDRTPARSRTGRIPLQYAPCCSGRDGSGAECQLHGTHD